MEWEREHPRINLFKEFLEAASEGDLGNLQKFVEFEPSLVNDQDDR